MSSSRPRSGGVKHGLIDILDLATKPGHVEAEAKFLGQHAHSNRAISYRSLSRGLHRPVSRVPHLWG